MCTKLSLSREHGEVVEFLLTPQAYGSDVSRVERIDTHASAVFLAGDRAYKLKRAVRYDYLDFSTPERRRRLCEAELALNRRTAPSLYLGVVPVTREPDRRLALGGGGTPVDWLVRMARFDQDALLDRMAARNALDLDVMPLLASAIAALHEGAERRTNQGGRAGMAWVTNNKVRRSRTSVTIARLLLSCGFIGYGCEIVPIRPDPGTKPHVQLCQFSRLSTGTAVAVGCDCED